MSGTPRAGARRWWIEALVVLTGFTLLAILVTWPVAANADTLIPGLNIAWDPAGYIWDFWQRTTDGMPLWGDSASHVTAIPFGRSYPAAADFTQLASYGPAWLVTKLAGPVVAYNVVVISGIAFAGIAMYALVRWVGAGAAIAAWAGGAYAVAPYELGKAIVHGPLTQIACFPLAVLAGLWWGQRPTWRRALVVVAAFGFAWLSNPYYGLLATVLLVVICGTGAVQLLRRESARAAGMAIAWLTGLSLLLVVIPVGLIGGSASTTASGTISRDVIDLSNFGAHFTDFTTPSASSAFMKGIDAAWPGVTGANGDERLILYVGITTLAIAIVGAIATWRSSDARLRLAARAGAIAVPVLVWFSLASPTTVLGVRIPVPSLWIWEVAPQFRVFARFAAPIMCALVLLGALGLRWLASRGDTLWRVTIITAAMIVTLVDLNTGLPVSTATPVPATAGTDLSDTPTWSWLRKSTNPGGVIAYPTAPEQYGPAFESRERVSAFGQTVHGRPLVNGATQPGQLGFDFTAQVSDPWRPGTATDLASGGVRFATIEPSAYAPLGLPANVDVRRPPAGFSVAQVFDDGTAIWRVTAAPAPGIVVFRPPGFAWGMANGATTWHGIRSSPAVITVWARRAGTYRVTLPLANISARAISPRAEDGREVTVVRDRSALSMTLASGPVAHDIALQVSGTIPAGAAIGRPTIKETQP